MAQVVPRANLGNLQRAGKVQPVPMGLERSTRLSRVRCVEARHHRGPLVDAGMRELWETGSMHNRVRMVVGSLLTKNLLIHWRLGEEWFWDTLVDADYACNPFNWQWVAGCGDDAARISEFSTL